MCHEQVSHMDNYSHVLFKGEGEVVILEEKWEVEGMGKDGRKFYFHICFYPQKNEASP